MSKRGAGHRWTSLGRYGDSGPWQVALPDDLRRRYRATARLRRGGRALLALSVTDRQTGATFEWTARGDLVRLSLPSDATEAMRESLWRDGRDIVGLAARQSGGPPRGTGPQPEDLARKALELRAGADWPTQPVLAEEMNLSVRQVRNIGERAPGPGKSWERILALAERMGAG